MEQEVDRQEIVILPQGKSIRERRPGVSPRYLAEQICSQSLLCHLLWYRARSDRHRAHTLRHSLHLCDTVLARPDRMTGRAYPMTRSDGWLFHPRLPLGICVDVRAIVVEQVALDSRLARAIQKRVFVRPKIRVVQFNIWIVSDVTCPGGSHGKQVFAQRFFMRRPVGPERTARGPISSTR